MTNTVNNGIPFVPENTTDPAAGLNSSLLTIDMLLNLSVESIGDTTPPATVIDGARYIVGVSATGAWSGHDNELAMWIDNPGYWQFRDVNIAFNKDTASIWVLTSSWSEYATTPSASGEVNTASNLGSGSGLYKQKFGVDLQFKSLSAGTNCSLDTTTDADRIIINVPNLSSESQQFNSPSVITEKVKSQPAALLQSITLAGSGSTNVMQDFCFDVFGGHTYAVHRYASGSDELSVINKYPIFSSTSIATSNPTSLLGHPQGFSIEYIDGDFRLWSSTTAGTGATRFKFNASADISNVETYILFPSDYISSTPTISLGQEFLVCRAKTTDTNQKVRIFDLKTITAAGAGDYSVGSHLYEWPLHSSQNFSGSIIQGIACDNNGIVYVLSGDELTTTNKLLNAYTISGDLIYTNTITTGKTEALAEGSLYEPEGLSFFETSSGCYEIVVGISSGATGARINRLWKIGSDGLKVRSGLLLTGASSSIINNNKTQGRQILEFRAKSSLTDGAGLNMYGSGDSTSPSELRGFSGAVTNTRFILDANGMFKPGSDNAYSLGTSSNRWSVVYAATSTINTSDERKKTFCDEEITNDLLSAWELVNFRSFRFNESIEEKGANCARVHFGVGAQTIKEIFESFGLDPFRYGILCHDFYDEIQEIKDDDGNIIQEFRPSGDIYGVRYEEALALECMLLRSKIKKIESIISQKT